MHRFLVRTLAVRTLAVFGVLLAALSCAERDGATPASRVATVRLAPRFTSIARAAETAPLAINRIRLTATTASDGTVLATKTATVVSSADEWDLSFPIPLPDQGEVSVLVTVELLNVVNGVESVQWSGITAPFTLTQGPIGEPVDVPVVRGPLSNLGVTSVTIAPTAPSVVEGATTPLNATVGGGGQGPIVYWTSLDPQVATVSDAGVVTGIVPGTARIVATVGARTDTVTVTVAVKVQTITVTPPSTTLQSIGATQTYTAKAFDPRGAQINNITIVLSVAPSNVAVHDGNGVMRAVANGTATVSATAQGVTGTATLTVQQVSASVVVTPPTASIANLGGTSTFTAQARDANGNAVAGAAITWEIAPTSVATITQSGVVTGVSNGSATVTARINATVFGTATVSVGNPVFFAHGFETSDVGAWTVTGVATAAGVANVVNNLVPTFVAQSSGDGLGRSPAAPQGTRYGWLSALPTGNYIGTQEVGDLAGSGGTTANGLSTGGSLVSPTFTVPANVTSAFLSFRSWFEIEGFDPSEFDLMTFAVEDANNNLVLASGSLNSSLSGSGIANVGTWSGGFSLKTMQVNNVGGRTLRIRFSFDTGDEQYNGFRGWIVDDVRFAVTAPAAIAGERADLVTPSCQSAVCSLLRQTPAIRRKR